MNPFKFGLSRGKRSDDVEGTTNNEEGENMVETPEMDTAQIIKDVVGLPGGKVNDGEEMESEKTLVEETAMTSKSFMTSLSGGKREKGEGVISEGKVVRETGSRDGKCIYWSPGFDARFPHSNQTRRCWQNYVDYFRCISRYGEDEKRCEYFRNVYEKICPGFWIEQFDEMRDSGSFPYNLE